ncbi:helix-turn-helix transcriptional regulator [Pseudomonas aeruginosa]|nr:helix-turn-helix transcriptional regulator [Pseudomonas aeruginosa]MBG5404636.1 helix-turn-helix transcriptional regulator [Pseudomonas aeruginosa]MBI8204071.1 helix-turn-helix transcriptional regulator [Pseudomonas aeruginosa]
MLGTRLKAARIRAGYSQKQLGMLVGMDEFSASARMNQYERERHSPNMWTSEQLAMVLQVPMAYLYCPEDELAELILKVSSLTPEFKKELTRFIEQLLAAQGSTSRQPVRTRSEL